MLMLKHGQKWHRTAGTPDERAYVYRKAINKTSPKEKKGSGSD